MGQLIKNAHDATSVPQIADKALEEAATRIQASCEGACNVRILWLWDSMKLS